MKDAQMNTKYGWHEFPIGKFDLLLIIKSTFIFTYIVFNLLNI